MSGILINCLGVFFLFSLFILNIFNRYANILFLICIHILKVVEEGDGGE